VSPSERTSTIKNLTAQRHVFTAISQTRIKANKHKQRKGCNKSKMIEKNTQSYQVSTIFYQITF